MATTSLIEIALLTVTSGVLIYAAWGDIRARKIPNEISIVLTLLFLLSATSTTLQSDFNYSVILHNIIWPLFVATLLFIGGLALFSLRIMGGGDVKLIAVLGLFSGPVYVLPFLLMVALSGGIVALATLAHSRMAQTDKPPQVPYGVAIAVGGLWLCFQNLLENEFITASRETLAI